MAPARAGLTAALGLTQRGYEVTVFERMPQPGGMMTYGIPAYRLPREALFAEIEHIWRAGVTFRQSMELGTDFTIKSLKDEGYAAVVLALGAHRSRNLGVHGEDKRGVYHAVQMLRDIASGDPPDLTGKRIVVVAAATRRWMRPGRRGVWARPRCTWSTAASVATCRPRIEEIEGRTKRECSSTSW